MKQPTEIKKSPCFKCEAGMCDICSHKHEWDAYSKFFNEDTINGVIEDKETTKENNTTKKLKCPHCGWEPNYLCRWPSPKNSDFYEGGGDYKCGKCGELFKL